MEIWDSRYRVCIYAYNLCTNKAVRKKRELKFTISLQTKSAWTQDSYENWMLKAFSCKVYKIVFRNVTNLSFTSFLDYPMWFPEYFKKKPDHILKHVNFPGSWKETVTRNVTEQGVYLSSPSVELCTYLCYNLSCPW